MDYSKYLKENKFIFDGDKEIPGIKISELSQFKFSKLEILNCDNFFIDFTWVDYITYDIEISNSHFWEIVIKNIIVNSEINIHDCNIAWDFKIRDCEFNSSFYFKHNKILDKEINIQNCDFKHFDFYNNTFKELNILNSVFQKESQKDFYIKNSVWEWVNIKNCSFVSCDLSNSNINSITFEEIKLWKGCNYINLKEIICEKFYFISINSYFFQNCNFIFYLSRINFFIYDEPSSLKIKLLSEQLLRNKESNFLNWENFFWSRDLNSIILHEKRIVLEIYKNLHIYENIDPIFLDIMNLKLKINYSWFTYFWKFFLFNKILWWGIKIQNLSFFVFLYIIFFWIIYNYSFTHILLENKINWFLLSFLSFFSIILPDKDITQLNWTLIYLSWFQSVSWTFFITLLIAMLVRKFMKI